MSLPEWEDGAVAVLSTAGDGPPHAIPISTCLRAGDARVLLALALRRESLARLRQDPRCALTLFGPDLAFTAHARATVLQEPMEVSDRVAAIALDVETVQDHRQPRFTIQAGVRWSWSEEQARERDDVIRQALRQLASGT